MRPFVYALAAVAGLATMTGLLPDLGGPSFMPAPIPAAHAQTSPQDSPADRLPGGHGAHRGTGQSGGEVLVTQQPAYPEALPGDHSHLRTQAAGPTDLRTLCPRMPAGIVGTDVERLQALLACAGYYTGAVDNQPGPRTLAAIQAFAGDHGMRKPRRMSEVDVPELTARVGSSLQGR